MTSSPLADRLGGRQHRASVVGERIHDRCRDRSHSLLTDDPVGDQLAELFGHEHEQEPACRGRYDEEVGRRDLLEVVREERALGL